MLSQIDLDRNLCQNVTYAIQSKCLDAVESQNYTIGFSKWPNAKGRCKKISRQLIRLTSRPASGINAVIYEKQCKEHKREIQGLLNIAALKWVSIIKNVCVHACMHICMYVLGHVCKYMHA